MGAAAARGRASLLLSQRINANTGKKMERKQYRTKKGTIVYWTSVPEAEVVGASQPPLTLVFLPGLTADHRLFDRQLSYFRERYRLLVWDAPGHGESRPFDLHFSLMDEAGWLHEILEKEKIARSVLVGQSMGGYVAQCFLQRWPDGAAGFVAIDSAPLQRKYVTAAEIWLLRRMEPFYRLYPWESLKKAGADGCAETAEGRRLMRSFAEGYDKTAYCALAGSGYRRLAEAFAADLPYRIACPALLLCGEKDRAGSTKRYNRRWTKEAGLPLVWIKGAGHNSNTDRPEEVNRLIDAFAAKL